MRTTMLRLGDEPTDLPAIFDQTFVPRRTGQAPRARPDDRKHQTHAPKEAFELVVLPHLDAAYNLARWLMRDRDAAEEVLQESMLRALTYFAGFKGVNPKAWLLQI